MTRTYLRLFLSLILLGVLFTFGGLFGVFFFASTNSELPVYQLGKKATYERQDFGELYALVGEAKLVNEAYEYRAEQEPPNGQVSGLLVNHHLLAADLVAEAFSAAEGQKVEQVLVISPDHFARSHTLASTTLADWNTPDGKLFSDQLAILELLKSDEISFDDEALKLDHGVVNMMPFIKRSFPNAEVIPLIIHNNATVLDLETLSVKLDEMLEKNTLIIGSFDFSHDAMPLTAQFHDQQSIAALITHDKEVLPRLDGDSPTGMHLFIELMERQNQSFHLLERTDSSIYTNNPNQTDVTSYIIGYYSDDPSTLTPSVNILAVGDLMMDRFIRQQQNKHSLAFPFEELGRFVWGNDIQLFNLEGTITNNLSIAGEEEQLQFTFDPGSAKTLSRFRFNLGSLANNHSRDFGADGEKQTKAFLHQAGIDYFGDYDNEDDLAFISEIRGQKLAFIGYNQFGTPNKQAILDEIRSQVKDNAFTIVYSHWGAEYQFSPSNFQQNLAHEFIDAGANLVLGAHPHVVQPIEIYRGIPIIYSLGNFLFDQDHQPGVREGLSVGITIHQDELEIYFFPLELNQQFQPVILSPEKARTWYAEYADSAVTEDPQIIEQIQQGLLKLSI